MDFKIGNISRAIAGCFEKITGRVRNLAQTACEGIGKSESNGPSLAQRNGKTHSVQVIKDSANSKEGSRVSKCSTIITTIISKIPILRKLIQKKGTNSHNGVDKNSSTATEIGACSSDLKETKSAISIPPGGDGAQAARQGFTPVIGELKSEFERRIQKNPEATVSKGPEEVSANHGTAVPVDEQRPSAPYKGPTEKFKRNFAPVVEQLKSKVGTTQEDTTISSEPSVDTESDVQETTQKQEITGAETVGSSSVDVSKLKKCSKEELGEIYSRAYSGESIVTEHGGFTFECTPQYQLSGFFDENGAKYTYTDENGTTNDYGLYSSNFGSKDHISNLWGQTISDTDGNEKMSFIRSGCSRGNEQAAKELLLNAAIMQKGGKEQFDLLIATNKEEPITLNLSNIQLMTPGKLGDGDIPLKQMQKLLELSNGPITVPYTTSNGDTVDVKIMLEEPLLFNFGVNLQHFKLGPLASSKKIDDQNAESFRKLFGAKPSELSSSALCREKSILGEFLAKANGTKKTRVEKLASQIIHILKNHPRGIESNPYALPVRVMLLTSLIGYATTYGCKSGKDRTGVCSLELEALATKLLSEGDLYNPEETTNEERNILQQLYLKGEANTIAEANTGQKGLKIQEFLGFTSLSERFGVNLADNFSDQIQQKAKKYFK